MTRAASPNTRRTGDVRVQGRAARIVNEVLRTTAEELTRVGYVALRVEDVALRSSVNKTTIYRRWPTKPELVAAALRFAVRRPEAPDTGSLRGDLLEAIAASVRTATSPIARGLWQMMQAERSHPEVERIATALRNEMRTGRAALVARAMSRGELPSGTDPMLIADLASAPVLSRLLTFSESVDDTFIAKVVDIVLAGARATKSS
ncbi:MAG TPA: TetR/AcrR family transcriptional regulator [Polyangiaceae bacterium]|jgi:AcrR family transcriptional regulator